MLNKIKEASKNMVEKGRNLKIKKPEINVKSSPAVLKILKLLIIFIILAVGVIQVVFGSMIYFAKAEDQVTKSVAKYIPFPAVYTSSGVVTAFDFYHEMDYINHFYASTDQAGIDQAELKDQIIFLPLLP